MSSTRGARRLRWWLLAAIGSLGLCGAAWLAFLGMAQDRIGEFRASDWVDPARINILLLGLDAREAERGPWRTDTMILISIDPAARAAGLLSIPRDLWVSIPGYAVDGKINTAHFIGDVQGYPGGGPALARATVERTFDLPVPYYVRLNFSAFERFIDLIGGVDIYVEQPIDDPAYPDESYGFEPLHIDAGWQHMDGRLALKYARTRHSAMGDFDRIRRQQQVIQAVRDAIVRSDRLPGLIAQIGPVLDALGDSVQTNLTLGQLAQLARLGAQIDPAQVRLIGIAPSALTVFQAPNDPPQEALVPIGDALQKARDQLLGVGAQPAALSPLPTPLVYVVVPGDTLFGIAQRFGVDVQAIVSINNLPGFDIYAGQALVIPSP